MTDLSLRGITKSFGPVPIIHGVDLDVADGEFVVLVGPSGCGKSTLLRIIAGLEKATTGEIKLAGRQVNDVAAADRGLAMVFQSYALYPHMRVRDNLAFGLENTKTPKAEVEARVAEIARMLRIEELLHRKPRQLSGGQRQRVAIGRAMVRRPGIFLLDEPLSNLDAELRVTMRSELAQLHSRIAATMIYVTHDQVEAMTLADRIAVMNAGRVEQVGAPLDLFNNPQSKFVAGFIGSPRMNFFEGQVRQLRADGIDLMLPGETPLALRTSDPSVKVGDSISVGIRPQHFSLSNAGMPVLVEQVEQLGSETIIYGQCPALPRIVMAQPGQMVVRPGETLHVDLGLTAVVAFKADGQRVGKKSRG